MLTDDSGERFPEKTLVQLNFLPARAFCKARDQPRGMRLMRVENLDAARAV